ncbi:GbsR/MarR family transcriptional regulator [Methanolobus profundi]|uniref:DNA-binding transcriptional regulator GbsR, MarR family n=1 Tax=Methanolobus profundi TaxID=487685 RepID=A0A1I4U8B8_9EURY|nr:hypothetical protein [Methanolobus profundi]SFM85214.1 DNA-binding transcriptional regulator GbsR, MarR family [Methanolobus profundi]
MDTDGKKEKLTANIRPVRPGDDRIGKAEHHSFPSPCLLCNRRSVSQEYPESAKDEFTELLTQNLKAMGFDEISSKILAFLFFETEEMSLEEISVETGYSLSAISTAMKKLSQYHILKRFTRPGSKKVFFILEKDLISLSTQMLRMRYESIFPLTKKILPGIIREYEQKGPGSIEDDLEVIKAYYGQMLELENIYGKLLEIMDNTNIDIGNRNSLQDE